MIKADKVVLRTPFHPFNPSQLESLFEAALQSPQFHEALLLSSPTLYTEFCKDPSVKEESLRLSLYKYFLRMSFRCTPFGLYSGVSVGTIDKKNNVQLTCQSQYQKHTRLDNHFLNSFIQRIVEKEEIRLSVVWFTNNTIYQNDDCLRFVEYRLSNSNRTHHLSKVQASDYLLTILENAKSGMLISDMIKLLVSDEVSQEEAAYFIKEIIDSKLLLSELEPIITGDEPYKNLRKLLAKYPVAAPDLAFLDELTSIINSIDAAGPGANSLLYDSVFNKMKEWDETYDTKLVLQSDLTKPVHQAEISEEVCVELQKTINFLAKLNSPLTNVKLKDFVQEFTKRYEYAEVPLMHVLDSESGLGYPVGSQAESDQSPLLKGLHFSNAPQLQYTEYKITDYHRNLIQQYQRCLESGSKEIVVNEKMFSINTEVLDDSSLPDSFYSMGSILVDHDCAPESDFKIDYTGSGGPSAADLLGRFCYSNDQVKEQVDQLVKKEVQLHPEKIFAEIVHLAQARIGNVLVRPSFREYEIPILTVAGVDTEHTIPLDDLMVSVDQGKIILRSKKHNKEVVPRNTSAHNYSLDTIPYYHFLSDLRSQESTKRLAWDWGVFQEFSFLPRIRYGKCILSKARWILREEDLKLSPKPTFADFHLGFQQYKNANQLPEWLVLAQSDNQLPLDVNNEMCLKILWQELKRAKRLELEECLFHENNLLVKGPEGGFTNEFIIPWTKMKEEKLSISPMKSIQNQISKRLFAIGSEWFYVKIYCGVKTADKILTEILAPLLNKFDSQGEIYQWFFIRYADPDFHLRIRLKGDQKFQNKVIAAFSDSLDVYLKSGQIWKVQCDTYQRELERYGDENMENSEALFYYDSAATLRILKLLDGDEGDQLRWQFAIKGVNDLLSDFGLPLEEKVRLMELLSSGFSKEFNAEDKQAQKQLSDHFRKYRKEIELALQPQLEEEHEYIEVWGIFKSRSEDWSVTIQKIKSYAQSERASVSSFNLLESYIHMFLNRFMRSKQRVHELVIYDFLCRYYRSAIGRKKKTTEVLELVQQ